MHYRRFRKDGTFELLPEMSLEERFWSKVDRSGGPDSCWNWLGALVQGYGCFDRTDRTGLTTKAHRLALIFSGVDLPDDVLACHTCDNRRCCNPAHLFPGTHADNNRDKAKKGRARMSKGMMNPNRKITTEQANEVRALYATRQYSQREIAERFGIDQTHVSRIVLGKAWT